MTTRYYTDEELTDLAEQYLDGFPAEELRMDGEFGSAAWVLDVFTDDELDALSAYLNTKNMTFVQYIHSAAMRDVKEAA